MTNNLVSKEAVLQILYEVKDNPDIPKNYGTILDIIRKIRNLPIEYDVDAKCKELNKCMETSKKTWNAIDSAQDFGEMMAYQNAIRIVRN